MKLFSFFTLIWEKEVKFRYFETQGEICLKDFVAWIVNDIYGKESCWDIYVIYSDGKLIYGFNYFLQFTSYRQFRPDTNWESIMIS